LQDFLQWTVGAIVWTLANAVYFDMRRKGVRGFGRFVAFCAGNPTTWITFFAVKEGRVETFAPPPDDDARLLREVRVDRELRGVPSPKAIEVRPQGTGGEKPTS
jgi:hypothetical protein